MKKQTRYSALRCSLQIAVALSFVMAWLAFTPTGTAMASDTHAPTSIGLMTAYNTITIDGDMSDWAPDELMESDGPYTLYLTWDANNIYLGLTGAYLGDTAGQDKSFFVCFDTDLAPLSGAGSDGYSNVNFNTSIFAPEYCYYFAGGAGWYEWSVWNGTSWDWLGWRDDNTFYDYPGNPSPTPGSELTIIRSDIGNPTSIGVVSWLTPEAGSDVEASWPTLNPVGTSPTMALYYHFPDLGTGISPNQAVLTEPLINEFVLNHTGTDTHEFIEMLGTPNANYGTFTLLEIEGDTSRGVIDEVITLANTNAGGYWFTDFLNNALENGTVSLLLVQDFAGNLGDDLDTDDDGTFDVTPWTVVVDDVAVHDGGAGDLTYAAVTLTAGFDGQPFTPGGASRIPNGTDTDSVSDWMRNDFDGEGLPGFIGTPVVGEAHNTPLAMNFATLFINEFVFSHISTDDHEFIEVLGSENNDYSTFTLLELEGDSNSTPGVIDEVITMTTTDANGYWFTGFLNNDLENGTVSLLLVQDFTGNLGDDLDTDNDGTLDITPWTVVIDDVAVHDGGAGDLTYAAVTLTVGYDGLPYAPGGASRIPNGTDSDTVDDWTRNDFDLAGIPGFTGTPESGEAYNTPLAANFAVPLINEFVFNHTGTDTHEFVEVFGSVNSDYSAFTLLELEGDGNSTPGVIDEVITMTSTDANGYWFTGFLNNDIENGTVSLLLVQDFSGNPGDDLDTDDDGVFDVTPWTVVVDDVAVHDGGAGDLTYAAVTLTVGFDGQPFSPGGASRIPNGTDTDSVSDWMRNDFDGEGLPGFTGTPELGEAYNTPLAINTAVQPTSDLAVIKDGPVSIMPGEDMVYTILVQNFSDITATNVILTDTLPVSTTYVADDSGVTPTNPSPGIYIWNLGDISSTMTNTIHLTITVDISVSAGTLTNQVEVTSTLSGDDPSNNTDTWDTTVLYVIPIYDIQYVPDPAGDDSSPYLGQVVIVEGIVTAEPGELGNSYMIIEDPSSGPWSGLVVYSPSGFGGLVAPPGTEVRVIGDIYEYYGLTEIQVSNSSTDITILSNNNPVPGPDILFTGDFDDTDRAISEQWESVYIEFQDATVTDTSLGYGEWHFDDGSGNARADDLGGSDGDLTYSPTEGDQYVFIRGIGWYSFSNYKLLPRSDDDIELVVTAPGIGKDAPVLVAPGDLFTYTITVENDFGYALTNVNITDVVPANSTFAYALDGGVEISGVVSWTVPSLPSFGSVQVRFAVTATTILTNIVNSDYAVVASNFLTPTYGAPIVTVVDMQLHIHHIQGAQHRSPLVDRDVTGVEGIVTAVRTYSFYMQDPNPDANDATSEGILVFTGPGHGVQVGDLVSVDGTAQEYYSTNGGNTNLSVTQLNTTPASIFVISSDNPLPPVTVIGIGGRMPPTEVIEDDADGTVEDSGIFDPDEDGIDFYESLEGMLVQVNDAQVVGPTRSFGEIAIVVDNGTNAGLLTPRGGIVIQPDDFNPERIILDDAIVYNEPLVNVGVIFTAPITGVIDYDFNNFKLFNVNPLPQTTGSLNPEITDLVPAADQLAIATFNVENLDPGDNTRFDDLAQEIVNNLGAPDIIGLQEIQDNTGESDDGTVDAGQTYQALIDAIAAIGGPTYEYRDIAPENNMDGGAPGGNIRVGFLFRTDRGLSFVDRPGGDATAATTVALGGTGVELSFSPGRVDPTSPAFNDSRKPLAGEFTFNDRKLFVIVNHFNSKGGDDALFGRFQPPVLYSEVQRLLQAQVLNNFVDNILNLDPTALVVVLGDLNDFQFSNPLETLKGEVLNNLIETLPPEEQYTYIYDGNSQVLDHILVSDALLDLGTQVDVVHVNAEFYELSQATDHDPVLALLDLSQASLQFSAADLSIGEGDANATITVTLDASAVVTITVDYATSDGNAIGGMDYTPVTGTLTFAPGESAKTFSVPILDDALYEGDETLALELSNPVSATLGSPYSATLTIVDNDASPAVQFSAADFSVGEGDGNATITVALDTGAAVTVTVDYATSDGSAIGGMDYTPVTGTLTFAPGESTQTFSVPILDDALYEGDETVLLELSNPVNATLGSPSNATLMIIEDDPEVITYTLYLVIIARE